MQPPTRSWVRRVLLPIALSVLAFSFIATGTVSPSEPLAKISYTQAASGTNEQTRSQPKLERDRRALCVVLIIADQLQGARH